MRIVLTLLLHLLATSATRAANTNNVTNLATLVAELSPCAQECVRSATGAVGCDLYDIDCQCSSRSLPQVSTNCMLYYCNVTEGVELSKFQAKACNLPHDSHNHLVRNFGLAAVFVSMFMIVIRVMARLWTLRRLWWDDYIHIMSGAFCIPLAVFGTLAAKHGLGNHLYDVEAKYASRLLFWFYLCEIFWSTSTFFIKLSILFFYLRIFPLRPFRWAVIGCMIFLVLSFLIATFLDIFQCLPVSATWTLHFANAQCINVAQAGYANAGTNIATEIAIIIVPIPVVRTLKLTGRKKASLYLLFGAGILVIAVAIGRVTSIKRLMSYIDPTYDMTPLWLWTCAEIMVGNMVAAAPALKPLARQAKQKIVSLRSRSKLDSQDDEVTFTGGAPLRMKNTSLEDGDDVEAFELGVSLRKLSAMPEEIFVEDSREVELRETGSNVNSHVSGPGGG